jgi:hypothetical protein
MEVTLATCFERARAVLDALMERASAFVTGNLDERIARRCRELRLAYDNRLLDEAREPVDYHKPTTQIAYVYRSLPSHAEFLFKGLHSASRALQAACDRATVRVACIGGGPGSDMVGFVKFLETTDQADKAVDFTVLDHERSWHVPRTEVVKTFGPNVRYFHQRLDLADTQSEWVEDWAFCEADIFTFSFVLSEVWCYNGSGAITGFIREVVRRARRGAVLVYVDNGGDCTEIADGVFDNIASLELISMLDDPTMRMGVEERRSVLEDEYSPRFNRERVKMGGNVSTRVWRKK